MVFAFVLLGVASATARTVAVGTAGKAPVAADAGCFGNVWNGRIDNWNCNRDPAYSPYWETDLYMDNTGYKSANVTVQADTIGKPVTCTLVTINNNATGYSASAPVSNTYYGASQTLGLSGPYLNTNGTSYVTCAVGYQGKVFSISYNQ
jgi:hypothetical protein